MCVLVHVYHSTNCNGKLISVFFLFKTCNCYPFHCVWTIEYSLDVHIPHTAYTKYSMYMYIVLMHGSQ